jgi:ElaB/YqjD/DUF883 family membrane-anchored ribosome-binding protein
MEIQEPSPGAVRMIEAFGLLVTALLLLVIACCLQLLVRVLTRGALQPELGILAFGFLFYVGAGFLSVGTRQQPEQSTAVIANLALSAGFLCVGWLCWSSEIPASWLALALTLTALGHGTSYSFALLRRRKLGKLAAHRGSARAPEGALRHVIQDAFVERLFRVQSSTYRAIPIGAAFGLVLGAMVTRDASALLRHCASGVLLAIALDEFSRIGAGYFARPPLEVQDAAAAADMRGVLLINRLQRMARIAIALLALFLIAV